MEYFPQGGGGVTPPQWNICPQGGGIHHPSGIFIKRGGGTPPQWDIYREGGGYTTSVNSYPDGGGDTTSVEYLSRGGGYTTLVEYFSRPPIFPNAPFFHPFFFFGGGCSPMLHGLPFFPTFNFHDGFFCDGSLCWGGGGRLFLVPF